ncbi:MAG: tetratricopeptide repeat protein, partial [Aestuariivirga sp.]
MRGRMRFGAVVLAAIMLASPTLARQPTPTERFETAESLDGNFLAAYVAGAAKDVAAASTYLREALREDPRNAELQERAFYAFLADGAMLDAFRVAERLAQRDPSNTLAQLALGIRAMKGRQYQSARAFLQKGGRGRAADITATLLTAWTQLGSGEPRRAMETVDRLKGENTYNLFRDYHAGLIADLAGNAAEAEKRLAAAYQIDQGTLRVVDAYGRFLARKGDRAGARQVYEAYERQSGSANPLVLDALAKVDQPQAPNRAVATAQQGAAEVLYGLGAAGHQQGDELAGMIYLRFALHLDPGHEMALLTLGDILERVKQPDDAILVYDRMPESSPFRTMTEVQVAFALEQMKKGSEALKRLEALVAARPADIEAKTALGRLYQSRKDFPQMADIYSKIIEQVAQRPDRTHWNLFYARGIAFERTKRWPLAEADFKKAIELVPQSDAFRRSRALVLNYLGYSWVDQGLNLDEG